MKRLMILTLTSIVLMAGLTPVLAKGPKGPSVVDVAIDLNSSGPFAGEFDTLIAAVLAADSGVLEYLAGNGQRTVFAPTDDAFADLGLDENNIGDLPVDFLTDVLLYHVAHGRRYSPDVLESDRIRMLDGGFLRQSGGVLTDNLGRESAILVPGVEAANGIIHAIGAVVLPYAP